MMSADKEPKKEPQAQAAPKGRAPRVGLLDNLMVPLVGGMALTVAALLVSESLDGEPWLTRVLTERGLAPYVAIWLFGAHATFLLLRYWLRIGPEIDALAHFPVPAGTETLGDEEVDAIAGRVADAAAKSGGTRLEMEVLMALALWKQKAGGARARETLAAWRKTYRATVRSAYLIPLGLTFGIALVGNWSLMMGADARADVALLAFPLSIAALLALIVTKRTEDRALAHVEDYVLLRLMTRLEFDGPGGESGGESEHESDDEPDVVPDKD